MYNWLPTGERDQLTRGGYGLLVTHRYTRRKSRSANRSIASLRASGTLCGCGGRPHVRRERRRSEPVESRTLAGGFHSTDRIVLFSGQRTNMSSAFTDDQTVACCCLKLPREGGF